MDFLGALLLVLVGVLAAPNIVLTRKPEWRDWLDKLAPYQGALGVVAIAGGLLMLLRWLLHLRALLSQTVYWLSFLAVALSLLVLGLLLGLNVLKQLFRQPQTVEKLERLTERLAPKQGSLGLAGVVVGIWMALLSILY
ncbi:MAG: hypothetical protein JXR83_15465 [Deltaproteobacteria bacterium]|nr:hypothetical protein [Deltaproteobacteria bacterium]